MSNKKQQKSQVKQQIFSYDDKQKFCMECDAPQTNDNPLRYPIGIGWSICQKCVQKTAKQLSVYRQNKPKLYPQIQQITPGLFLGNEDAAVDEKIIQKYQISAICVCGSYLTKAFEGKKVQGKFEEIIYIQHQIADFQDQKIIHLFDGTCDWVQQRICQGRNVLIHCAAGVSRSASFVIAYLMNKKGMLFADAYRHVKEIRKVIRPNSGFEKQLQDYCRALIQKKMGTKHKQQYEQKNNKKQEWQV